ncbi:hypothetical protein ASPCAL02930 [Aspergillus calidoustus]|uniref:ABM domain-containing protein n=1 Tax=Aspergillus calidoustus TaxID=454130 RepID=A0A0U4ZWT8_ASPCI|nr:hypothetical protein ASPCAL02930 [Aspergillus calidoustus]
MSRPVTEVVTLTLLPGANAEEAIKGLNSVLSRREGFQSLKWGRWEQDKTKVNLIIGWDDVCYHKAFEQSATDSAAAGAFLGPVLAGPPFMFHVYLDPAERDKILGAPVVEVATFFSVPDDYSVEGEKFLEILGSFKGGLGFLHADVVEEISAGGSGQKGRGWFVLLAWESIDLHVAAKDSDAVQQNYHLIKGEGKTDEIEWHYVRFRDA